MSHLLYKIGNFSGRHPWRVIAAWVMVAFAVVMLNQSAGGQPDDDFRLPGSESQRAADLIQEYEARIAALERLVGKQALELELLKGALKHAPRPKSATNSIITGPPASPSAEGAS